MLKKWWLRLTARFFFLTMLLLLFARLTLFPEAFLVAFLSATATTWDAAAASGAGLLLEQEEETRVE